ncbi:PTP [Bracoviriform demolitoris]|uniref:Truncated tyrosine phosphatase D1 n=1 Tax=Microplitis demolitor bracovirus (isolate Webb) TaxID=654919 RepID=PTPD1_MDBVW|nr:PTP [Bracoviriform demolitoris]Q5I154.1 RecName: Full=Truncated tyrosine phosphatase D1; Short=PTP-D1 [Microplitis demolitor bracovirus (isolate Webb)]AAW51780.1 PTP [Bracoviriform demolitoris]
MRRPNCIAEILRQHTQIIEESNNYYYLKMKTKDNKSQGPLRSLLCLPKNVNQKTDSAFCSVDGYNVKNKFLCTRSPNQDSLYQFWSMAYKKNIHIIVMLSPIDNLMRHRYWSLEEDEVFECREFRIRLRSSAQWIQFLKK